MSYTKLMTCQHCEGKGVVIDYDAIDITLGSDEVPSTTKMVICPMCLGKGEGNVNPTEETRDD